MVQAVREYYALMPRDVEEGWSGLGPALKTAIGGYEDYRAFWDTIAAVEIDRVVAVEPPMVTVDLEFTRAAGGTTSRERHRLRLDRRGGRFVINGQRYRVINPGGEPGAWRTVG